MSKPTGITIERLNNGFLIGVMGESTKLFSREVELGDTEVAKTKEEVLKIVGEKITKLKPRESTFLDYDD